MSKLSAESNALHAACLEEANKEDEPTAKKFVQAELQALAKCSAIELAPLIQELGSHLLFRAFKPANGPLSWSVRSKDSAVLLLSLSEAERIVYLKVEDAGLVGIWIKQIKSSTQIPPNEVQKAINKLERMKLIKGVKNVKSPTQRIYMLFHLAPGIDVTGGSFFDGGELDESMVEELCNLIIFHVRSSSWEDSRKRARRGSSFAARDDEHSTSDARKRKRAVESIEHDGPRPSVHQNGIVIEDDSDDGHTTKRRRQDSNTSGKKRPVAHDIEDGAAPARRRPKDTDVRPMQLAYPAGTKDYPSTESILDFLRSCDAIREGKAESLNVEEVQGLIDVLVWDDKLEKVRNGYRTVRGVQFSQLGAYDENGGDGRGNGLTEVPCGRCQLFDLCQEGTKVSAESCKYFDDWLAV